MYLHASERKSKTEIIFILYILCQQSIYITLNSIDCQCWCILENTILFFILFLSILYFLYHLYSIEIRQSTVSSYVRYIYFLYHLYSIEIRQSTVSSYVRYIYFLIVLILVLTRQMID
jgi:hypothetical protein